MRERKRPDWTIQTYKFFVEPLSNMPQAVWDCARQKQILWNDLVVLREEYLQKYLPQRETMNAAEKKAFWDEFTAAARGEVNAAGLDWENAGDVYDRFFVAHRRGFAADAGKPKVQHGLQKVRLVHRYTGGGMDISRLTSARASRFVLARFPAARHYEHNVRAARRARLGFLRFGLGETTIPLHINLHRALPRAGFVKQVALGGEFDNLSRAWRWHVVITIETEPRGVPRAAHHAAVDLGWRKFADYIRIGYVFDDDENEIELRLPLDFSTQQARRQGYPCDHLELERLEASIASGVDEMKKTLSPMQLTDAPLGAAWTKMRQGGLKKMLHALEVRENELMPDEFHALERLREWKHRNDGLQTRYNKSAARFVGRRQWLYRNLAAWLTKTYGVIAWEGDLSVKEMAEADTSDNPALDASMTYRHIAAIGEFRLMLKHAAEKNNCLLVNAPAAYSTITCETCGAQVAQDGKIILICPNGHTWDQDANAARNLFSQIPGDIATESDLRKNEGVGGNILNIPDKLRGVAVDVHLIK